MFALIWKRCSARLSGTVSGSSPAQNSSLKAGVVGARHRLLATLTAGLMLLFAVGAYAQTAITVTSTADTGTGSLRAAITTANGENGDTITFDVTGTITLASALPPITAPMTIQGPGASLLTISGANLYQVFSVSSTATVTLSGLTLANGVNSNGAAVYNAGTLTINQCTITGSSGANGAIYNYYATVTLSGITFTGNSGANGAIVSYGTMTVTDSTFTGNSAPSEYGEGAAINSMGGALNVTNSTFVDNSASQGGAINGAGDLTVTNSTFTGNAASSSYGGAIYYQSSSGSAVLNNNIFWANTAIGGAGIGSSSTGTATDTESNNLFYQEVATGLPSGNSIYDCQCSNNTNPIDSDPKLAPLGNYGGSTQTLLPSLGSAAICAGSAALVPSGTTTDQRGFPLSTSSCPAGQVDVGAVQTNYLTVTTLSDSDDGSCGGTCSLRDAITVANSAGMSDIAFSPSLSGTIALTSSLPTLAGQLNISGPVSGPVTSPGAAVTVSGGGSPTVGSIFTIDSDAQVSFSGLTVANGNASNGGAILNHGTVTVNNSSFSGNSTPGDSGGAIENFGALAVNSSTFNGNSSSSGDTGDGGAIDNAGSVAVTNSTFSGNASGDTGGAISNGGTLTVSDSTFTGNSSANGGAVGLMGGGSATIANSIVANNTSTSNGAGIFTTGGLVNAYSNLFYGNLYNGSESDCFACTINSGEVTGNSMLAPLGNYGGSTQTMLPQPGSAAICAASMAYLPAGVTTDQRGFSRLNTSYGSSACLDLGAVQTNYQSVQFTNTSFSGTTNTPISPAPVVLVTENGQNIAGVPVTLTFSGTGTASGLGPVTTVAGLGASFGDVVVNAAGSDDQLSASLQITPTYSLSTPTPATLDIAISPQTISFALPVSQVIYGATAIALNATSTSGLPVAFAVVSGPATLSGAMLTITGVGAVVVEASQAGNASFAAATAVEHTLTVNPAPLAVTVNSFTRAFGTANPTLTGTAATFVNGDTAASAGLVYSTTATSTSAPGTYPITASLSNPAAAQNYVLSVTPGTLTVTATSSLISWPSPAAIPYGTPLSAVQLDATASVAGTFAYNPPAGTILNAGTQTLSVTFTPSSVSDYATASATTTITVTPVIPSLSFAAIPPQTFGSAPFALSATSISPAPITYSVVSGPATVSGNLVTLIGAGTVVVSASQAASGNYAPASATTSFMVTEPSFTLAPTSSSGSSTGPVIPGAAVVFHLTLMPSGSTYPDALTLSASGLPPGATATFSPASIAAGSAATPITLTIQTSQNGAAQTARNETPYSPFALGFVLLPLLGRKRLGTRLRRMPRLTLLAALLCLGAGIGLSGCAGGYFDQPQQSYNVVVTATDQTTHAQISTTLTLALQ